MKYQTNTNNTFLHRSQLTTRSLSDPTLKIDDQTAPFANLKQYDSVPAKLNSQDVQPEGSGARFENQFVRLHVTQ